MDQSPQTPQDTDDGPIHRWDCTTHNGDGCDGHCDPATWASTT